MIRCGRGPGRLKVSQNVSHSLTTEKRFCSLRANG